MYAGVTAITELAVRSGLTNRAEIAPQNKVRLKTQQAKNEVPEKREAANATASPISARPYRPGLSA